MICLIPSKTSFISIINRQLLSRFSQLDPNKYSKGNRNPKIMRNDYAKFNTIRYSIIKFTIFVCYITRWNPELN